MRMDEGMDTGPILLQEDVLIVADETAGQLYERLARKSGGFLIRTLEWMAQDRLKERPQDQTEATYAPKINRRMSFVKWDRPAQDVSALIRALDPWPGALTTLGGKEIKLFSSRVADEEGHNGIPGRVAGHSQGCLQVETGRGVVLIRELQMPGKKRLCATDFLRGFALDKGSVLGR
jgi:methionyl-tRNA formyltransferase